MKITIEILCLVFFVLFFIYIGISMVHMHQVDWGTSLSTVFAGVSALVAAAAIYIPAREQRSQKFLDQAIISLERAYEIISNNGGKIQPPMPDRLNWLTSARHIEKYRHLKKLISHEEHLLICEEQEEYWRHKFYLALTTSTPLLPNFYEEKSESHKQLGIEPKSAIIIHDFAKWPDGKQDPIELADTDSILKRGRVLQGNIGLRQYLKSLPGYQDKI